MAASTTSLARDPGRGPQLGLPLHLDPGHRRSCCAPLYRLGFDWEALEYFAFILEAVRGKDPQALRELQIMYGIGGERDLTERTLDHLSGWRDSKPVRVGNGAWNQHQNDVWGMLLDAVDTHTAPAAPRRSSQPVWEGLAGFVEDAITHAGDADQGIWEIRGEPQHFTASAVLCWVAADRGADLARSAGTPSGPTAGRRRPTP